MEKMIADLKDQTDQKEKIRISRKNIFEEDGFITEIDAGAEEFKKGSDKDLLFCNSRCFCFSFNQSKKTRRQQNACKLVC